MNTYYKLSLLYFFIGAFFLIVGFYVSRDFSGLKEFYEKPHIAPTEEISDGEIA